jgi:hypothetical protein
MGPAIAKIELVDELLTQRQRRQCHRGTVEEAQVKVVELGLADQPAIGQLELVQMRAVPAGERGVDGVSELTELVGTSGGEDPTRSRPVILTMTADQIHSNRQPRPRHD